MSADSDWRTLALEMSEISEQAFHAGWMEGLEYRLWEIVNGDLRKYGQIVLTEQQVARLQQLADEVRGWVRFNDATEVEEFVNREHWQRLYDAWAASRADKTLR